VFSTNPNHSPTLAVMKEINSTPAKTSTLVKNTCYYSTKHIKYNLALNFLIQVWSNPSVEEHLLKKCGMSSSDRNTEIIKKSIGTHTELSTFPESASGIYSFPLPDLRIKYEAIKL